MIGAVVMVQHVYNMEYVNLNCLMLGLDNWVPF